jgi:hypothetical protein
MVHVVATSFSRSQALHLAAMAAQDVTVIMAVRVGSVGICRPPPFMTVSRRATEYGSSWEQQRPVAMLPARQALGVNELIGDFFDVGWAVVPK